MKQAVGNRPLSGTELRKIILRDIEAVLDQDGMLVHHIAYSRVAYSITVKLHLDNPSYPEHVSTTTSRKPSLQELVRESEREAVEGFPLTHPSEDLAKKGKERNRKINSPNRARIENEIPVVVTVRQNDGTMENKEIKYDISDYPDEIRQEILDTDRPEDKDIDA